MLGGQEVTMNTIDIVVGISSSPAADAALRWALTKAERTGSAVTAVHVYDESEHADLPLESDREDAVRESHHRAQMLASIIAGDQAFHGPFTFHARTGDLEDVLVEEAAGAGVVVVGVPQRERHDEFLDRLAARAQCAVVAVDEHGPTRVIGRPASDSVAGAAS
jgi:nucleotide-binding universal stress UspA family protein